jgi:hypothetical protein
MSDDRTAYYLYCLTPPGSRIQAGGIGVDGRRPVSVAACGDIGAVLSEVEPGEFFGEAAEARLGDLEWLGPRVCRHEQAVEAVMRETPVLPARFATLFTSLSSLEESVLEHREAIAGFFTRLGDKQEWAVKGLLDRTEGMKKPGPQGRLPAEESVSAGAPGARYFQEKRIQARWERDFTSRLKEFCRKTAAALGALGAGFQERKILVPVAPGTDVEVVLNWAFLLSPAALDGFRDCLERLNGDEAFPGLALTLSGPWPPYSFVPDLSGGVRR